jgi:hypothetical protein
MSQGTRWCRKVNKLSLDGGVHVETEGFGVNPNQQDWKRLAAQSAAGQSDSKRRAAELKKAPSPKGATPNDEGGPSEPKKRKGTAVPFPRVSNMKKMDVVIARQAKSLVRRVLHAENQRGAVGERQPAENQRGAVGERQPGLDCLSQADNEQSDSSRFSQLDLEEDLEESCVVQDTQPPVVCFCSRTQADHEGSGVVQDTQPGVDCFCATTRASEEEFDSAYAAFCRLDQQEAVAKAKVEHVPPSMPKLKPRNSLPTVFFG